MKHKHITIKSSGKSMFPLVSSGDKLSININLIKFKNLKVGSIIAFKNGLSILAHRIVKRVKVDKKILFITKGDLNIKNDKNFVSEKNYLGVVKRISNPSHIFNLSPGRTSLLTLYLLLFSFLFKMSFFRSFLNNLSYNHTFYNFFIFLFADKVNFKPFRENKNAVFMQYLLLNFKETNFNSNCKWNFSDNFVDEEKLFIELKKNKMGFFFDHFVNCHNCSNYFSNSIKRKFLNKVKENFARIFYLNKIKNRLEPILIKNKIKFIKLKKCTSLSNSYDIDYLVKKSDFKLFSALLMVNDFYIEDIPPQEVSFRHKKHLVEVDAHFYTSIPRDDIFNLSKTKKLTKEIVNSSINGKIDREYMLLSTVARFWTNDFHRGLRKLYEIGSAFDDQKINWKKYLKLSKKYSFFEESLLTISIVERILKKNIISKEVAIKSNSRYKLLSKYFSLKKLSTFNESKLWWDENNLQTRKHLLELHLLKLALNNSYISLLRKPRVLWLFITCLFTD